METRPFFSYVITYEFWIREVGKFICNLHMNSTQKFTYEFICKFTYEFVCHRFFRHELSKCSHCNGSILFYNFLQKDLKSQNVRVRWLNFALQIPTKGHPTRKIFACGGSILPSNLTQNHKTFSYSFVLLISDLNLHMNSYVIYIWILMKFICKFTYEKIICKFTYEFICPLFWILESRKKRSAPE